MIYIAINHVQYLISTWVGSHNIGRGGVGTGGQSGRRSRTRPAKEVIVQETAGGAKIAGFSSSSGSSVRTKKVVEEKSGSARIAGFSSMNAKPKRKGGNIKRCVLVGDDAVRCGAVVWCGAGADTVQCSAAAVAKTKNKKRSEQRLFFLV